MVGIMMEEEKKNEGPDPFADYMWMTKMDEFDKEIEKEFEEENFIMSCIEQLLEEEEEQTIYFQHGKDKKPAEPEESAVPSDQIYTQRNPNVNGRSSHNSINTVNSYDQLIQNTQQMFISPSSPYDSLYQPQVLSSNYYQPFGYSTNSYSNYNNDQHQGFNNNMNGNYRGNQSQSSFNGNIQNGYSQPNSTNKRSMLNPNAPVFMMNPNAKAFVPKSFAGPQEEAPPLNPAQYSR